jgi:hypothetical protein
MAQRQRYWEHLAYRSLVKDYFKRGARWTAAPKPTMGAEMYRTDFPPNETPERWEAINRREFITTEFEPCFDAADFTRFGRDIFAQQSMVTNMFGIEWMRQHLGPKYRVHDVRFRDSNPVHMDATLVPLRPGLVMSNPSRPCNEVDLFTKSGWRVVQPPKSESPSNTLFCSYWVSMNMLAIDDRRVCVEASEKETIKFLESLGAKPIPVPFQVSRLYIALLRPPLLSLTWPLRVECLSLTPPPSRTCIGSAAASTARPLTCGAAACCSRTSPTSTSLSARGSFNESVNMSVNGISTPPLILKAIYLLSSAPKCPKQKAPFC